MKRFRKFLYILFVLLLVAFVASIFVLSIQSITRTSSSSYTVSSGNSANNSTSGSAPSASDTGSVSNSASGSQSQSGSSGSQESENSSGGDSNSSIYYGTTLPAGGDMYGYWNTTDGGPEFYVTRIGDDDLQLVTLVELPSMGNGGTHLIGAYIVYPAAYDSSTGTYYLDVDNPYDISSIEANGGYVCFFNLADEAYNITPDMYGDGYDAVYGGFVNFGEYNHVYVIPVIVEVDCGQRDPDYPPDLSDMNDIVIVSWYLPTGEEGIYEYDI